MELIEHHLEKYSANLFSEKTVFNPKNNLQALKEEIWAELSKGNHRGSRKMFFIKVSKMQDYDLLEIRNWSRTTDNFARAFYGACKKWNIRYDYYKKLSTG